MNCIKSFLVAASERYEDFKTIRHLEKRIDFAEKGIILIPLLNSSALLPATPEESKMIIKECNHFIGAIRRKQAFQL